MKNEKRECDSVVSIVRTKLGVVRVESVGNDVIVSIGFAEGGKVSSRPSAAAVRVREQLNEYVDGERQQFDLPLRAQGTAFQQRVWDALRAIPFGETRSYAAVARSIGRPTATRAVGAACGKNPIGIVVPCHRVVGSGGALTGYYWGTAMKAKLLELEGVNPASPLFAAKGK